jgi:glycosyltransferase involved in cell wall biosynthesis
MTSAKRPTISAFFPFLNDWGTIGSLVTAVDTVLIRIASNYEIIIVDDGSDEKSKEILRMLTKRFPKLRIITHKTNRGYGGALKTGIYNSKMDWIFYTDGDAQYDPRELEELVKNKKKRADVVNGYKIRRSDPWFRILTGRTYHYFVKTLFNLPIRDTDCDFRLMRREIFDNVKLEQDSGLICAEMIKKIDDFGYKFQEVPVHHYWRTSGKSQFFNFRRVSKVVFGLLVLWYKLVIKKEHLKYADTKSTRLNTSRA